MAGRIVLARQVVPFRRAVIGILPGLFFSLTLVIFRALEMERGEAACLPGAEERRGSRGSDRPRLKFR